MKTSKESNSSKKEKHQKLLNSGIIQSNYERLMKPFKNMEKLLIIDHSNKIITQKRELNPPSFNARFRSEVKKQYPDYELR